MTTNGAAIRVIRNRSGWSLTRLAATIGVSHGYLSNIEAGRRQASPEVTRAIADALEVPLASITGTAPTPEKVT